jgi:hypothetical protein
VITGPSFPSRPDQPPPELPDPLAAGDTNAWDWAHTDLTARAELADHVADFVAYLNSRYAWTREHTVPPCWAGHGALVEELTTLMWSRWSAFQAPTATPEAAQAWHAYYLPGFLARLNYWLGPQGALDCRAGKHEPTRLHRGIDRPSQARLERR